MQNIVWYKQHFYPLGKREVQSAEVKRVVCLDLQYWTNTCMFNFPHPGLAWIHIYHKPQWFLIVAIYTNSSSKQSPRPCSFKIFVCHNTHLYPLINREVQSAENSLSGCWNLQHINNTHAQLISHTIYFLDPSPAKCFSSTIPSSVCWEREMFKEFLGWFLRLTIYTQSSKE